MHKFLRDDGSLSMDKNSLSMDYIDKESYHRLSETTPILYIKYMPKYQRAAEILVV